ncbi:hypothetical protein EON79_00445 [bacterium]|nr:MAG: hypothetical protein EON79_00445 [bacterium]
MELDRIAKTAASGSEAVAVAIRWGGAAGGWRKDAPYYPASVVKLLYFDFALAHFPERSAEFERSLRDMIVDSSNDATALVLDILTDTTGGPELDAVELETWMHNRQRINAWYRGRGYGRLNACQKTWNEGPYGRERQGYGPNMERRNSLTAAESLSILVEFAERHPRAPDYLWREPGDPQFDEFLGACAPSGWRVASKAGWTSEVSHDVALFLAPEEDRSLGLAVFTKGASDRQDWVTEIGRKVVSQLVPEARRSL